MMDDRAANGRAVPVPAGRMARMARMGSVAAGIAGNMALTGARAWSRGNRADLRDLALAPANLRRLTEQLAHMRGAAMKIGQMMSMDAGEVLPPEMAEILSRLRSDAHFMPPRQLKQVLTANWGDGWLRAFERFEVRPIAAASIGQVHRARLRDGRELAVKVQYPGIARSIDSDVANVGFLIRLSGLIPDGFDAAPYLREARRQLHEETDYLREGEQMEAFGARLAGLPAFRVPRLHRDWSTQSVLAMSYEPGQPIEAAADAAQALRDRIVFQLVDLALREVFAFGIVQSDPNFANYRFDPETGQIVLLDFGATRAIDPLLAAGYRRLIASGLEGDRTSLRAAAEEIGILTPGMRADHAARVLDCIGMVFAAIGADAVHDFADPGLSRRLQEESLALARDGFVPPPVPMDVLYLQRKLGGLYLLAHRLRARVPLSEMIRESLSHGQAGAARGIP